MSDGVPGSHILRAVVEKKGLSAMPNASGPQKNRGAGNSSAASSGAGKADFSSAFMIALGEGESLAGTTASAEEGFQGPPAKRKKAGAGINAEAVLPGPAGQTGVEENRQVAPEAAREGRLFTRAVAGGLSRESSRGPSNPATTASASLSKAAGRFDRLLSKSVEEGGSGADIATESLDGGRANTPGTTTGKAADAAPSGKIKVVGAVGPGQDLGAAVKAVSQSSGKKGDAGVHTLPVFKAGDHDGLTGVNVSAPPGGDKTSSGKVGVKTERSGRKDESAVSASRVSAPDGAPEGSEETAGRVDGGSAKGFKDSSASFREQVERLEGFGTETQAKSTRFQADAKTASPQNSCDLPGNQGLLMEAKESLSAAAKETTSRPVSTQAVIDKIAENGQLLLRAGSGRVRLTLSPPQLGTLDVDLRVSRDRLKMVLTAENGEVRQILQSNMEQLKSTLQGQGWNLERMDVVVQDQYGKDLGQPDQGSRSFGGNDPGQSWGDGGRGSGYSMESDDSPFLSGDGILNVFV